MPECGRLIYCIGHDWSLFTCVGEMRMISNGRTGKRKHVGPRFFKRRKDGTFESDRETWKDVEEWHYMEETP